MLTTILGILLAVSHQPPKIAPEPRIHVVLAECVSTTVTKSPVVRSTFEVVGANGRYDPFEVEYARPMLGRRLPTDLLVLPPFTPGEQAFWIVTENQDGKLEPIVAPEKARPYLPNLRNLTLSVNTEAVDTGKRDTDSQEIRTAKTLASLVSACVEPEMRDRLPLILGDHRKSTDPVIREFIRWFDAQTPPGRTFVNKQK